MLSVTSKTQGGTSAPVDVSLQPLSRIPQAISKIGYRGSPIRHTAKPKIKSYDVRDRSTPGHSPVGISGIRLKKLTTKSTATTCTVTVPSVVSSALDDRVLHEGESKTRTIHKAMSGNNKVTGKAVYNKHLDIERKIKNNEKESNVIDTSANNTVMTPKFTIVSKKKKKICTEKKHSTDEESFRTEAVFGDNNNITPTVNNSDRVDSEYNAEGVINNVEIDIIEMEEGCGSTSCHTSNENTDNCDVENKHITGAICNYDFDNTEIFEENGGTIEVIGNMTETYTHTTEEIPVVEYDIMSTESVQNEVSYEITSNVDSNGLGQEYYLCSNTSLEESEHLTIISENYDNVATSNDDDNIHIKTAPYHSSEAYVNYKSEVENTSAFVERISDEFVQSTEDNLINTNEPANQARKHSRKSEPSSSSYIVSSLGPEGVPPGSFQPTKSNLDNLRSANSLYKVQNLVINHDTKQPVASQLESRPYANNQSNTVTAYGGVPMTSYQTPNTSKNKDHYHYGKQNASKTVYGTTKTTQMHSKPPLFKYAKSVSNRKEASTNKKIKKSRTYINLNTSRNSAHMINLPESPKTSSQSRIQSTITKLAKNLAVSKDTKSDCTLLSSQVSGLKLKISKIAKNPVESSKFHSHYETSNMETAKAKYGKQNISNKMISGAGPSWEKRRHMSTLKVSSDDQSKFTDSQEAYESDSGEKIHDKIPIKHQYDEIESTKLISSNNKLITRRPVDVRRSLSSSAADLMPSVSSVDQANDTVRQGPSGKNLFDNSTYDASRTPPRPLMRSHSGRVKPPKYSRSKSVHSIADRPGSRSHVSVIQRGSQFPYDNYEMLNDTTTHMRNTYTSRSARDVPVAQNVIEANLQPPRLLPFTSNGTSSSIVAEQNVHNTNDNLQISPNSENVIRFLSSLPNTSNQDKQIPSNSMETVTLKTSPRSLSHTTTGTSLVDSSKYSPTKKIRGPKSYRRVDSPMPENQRMISDRRSRKGHDIDYCNDDARIEPLRRHRRAYQSLHAVLQDHTYGAAPPMSLSPPGSPAIASTSKVEFDIPDANREYTDYDDDASSIISLESPVQNRTFDEDGEETETAAEEEDYDGYTRCVCEFDHDDGFMIQCDTCGVWQHISCVGIKPTAIPSGEYFCNFCARRYCDGYRARILQGKVAEKLAAGATVEEAKEAALAHADRVCGPIDKPKPRRKRRETSSSHSPMARTKRVRREAPPGRSKKQRAKKDVTITPPPSVSPTPPPQPPPPPPPPPPPIRRPTGRRKRQNGVPEERFDIDVFVENYENAVTNHYSPELRARLLNIIKKNEPEMESFIPPEEPLCRSVSLHEGRMLVSTKDLEPGTAISELMGKYMVSVQHRNATVQLTGSSARMYTQRPGPFVFFYRLPKEAADVCIDCRTYGNEARFARRSCKPNADLIHWFDKGILHIFINTIERIPSGQEITIRHEMGWHGLGIGRTPTNPCACATLSGCILLQQFGQLFREPRIFDEAYFARSPPRTRARSSSIEPNSSASTSILSPRVRTSSKTVVEDTVADISTNDSEMDKVEKNCELPKAPEELNSESVPDIVSLEPPISVDTTEEDIETKGKRLNKKKKDTKKKNTKEKKESKEKKEPKEKVKDKRLTKGKKEPKETKTKKPLEKETKPKKEVKEKRNAKEKKNSKEVEPDIEDQHVVPVIIVKERKKTTGKRGGRRASQPRGRATSKTAVVDVNPNSETPSICESVNDDTGNTESDSVTKLVTLDSVECTTVECSQQEVVLIQNSEQELAVPSTSQNQQYSEPTIIPKTFSDQSMRIGFSSETVPSHLINPAFLFLDNIDTSKLTRDERKIVQVMRVFARIEQSNFCKKFIGRRKTITKKYAKRKRKKTSCKSKVTETATVLPNVEETINKEFENKITKDTTKSPKRRGRGRSKSNITGANNRQSIIVSPQPGCSGVKTRKVSPRKKNLKSSACTSTVTVEQFNENMHTEDDLKVVDSDGSQVNTNMTSLISNSENLNISNNASIIKVDDCEPSTSNFNMEPDRFGLADEAAGMLLAFSQGIAKPESQDSAGLQLQNMASMCDLVEAAVAPLETSLKVPKTKKAIMNEWLNKIPEPIQNKVESHVSPDIIMSESIFKQCVTSPNDNKITMQDTLNQFETPKRISLPLKSPGYDSNDGNKSPVVHHHNNSGSAKKRWLHQALSEESDLLPNNDAVAPLKKRRLARESISSVTASDPIISDIGVIKLDTTSVECHTSCVDSQLAIRGSSSFDNNFVSSNMNMNSNASEAALSLQRAQRAYETTINTSFYEPEYNDYNRSYSCLGGSSNMLSYEDLNNLKRIDSKQEPLDCRGRSKDFDWESVESEYSDKPQNLSIYGDRNDDNPEGRLQTVLIHSIPSTSSGGYFVKYRSPTASPQEIESFSASSSSSNDKSPGKAVVCDEIADIQKKLHSFHTENILALETRNRKPKIRRRKKVTLKFELSMLDDQTVGVEMLNNEDGEDDETEYSKKDSSPEDNSESIRDIGSSVEKFEDVMSQNEELENAHVMCVESTLTPTDIINVQQLETPAVQTYSEVLRNEYRDQQQRPFITVKKTESLMPDKNVNFQFHQPGNERSLPQFPTFLQPLPDQSFPSFDAMINRQDLYPHLPGLTTRPVLGHIARARLDSILNTTDISTDPIFQKAVIPESSSQIGYINQGEVSYEAGSILDMMSNNPRNLARPSMNDPRLQQQTQTNIAKKKLSLTEYRARKKTDDPSGSCSTSPRDSKVVSPDSHDSDEGEHLDHENFIFTPEPTLVERELEGPLNPMRLREFVFPSLDHNALRQRVADYERRLDTISSVSTSAVLPPMVSELPSTSTEIGPSSSLGLMSMFPRIQMYPTPPPRQQLPVELPYGNPPHAHMFRNQYPQLPVNETLFGRTSRPLDRHGNEIEEGNNNYIEEDKPNRYYN